MARKRNQNIEVDALRHHDTRVNIPTSELRDFAGDDEANPGVMTYARRYQLRDEALDPQLVWNGKYEQDADGLDVPAVPIYIQEKIQPQAIIDEVKRAASEEAGPDETPQQMDLFSDFNGLDSFEQVIEFYQHEQHWTNRMILGDSLMVMNSLAEKEGLKGQVQMIYLDPPYGIKFGSNWQVSTRKRDVKDGKEEDLVRQPEQVRAFRDTWEKGIHSYLSYLRDRLTVARELLTESGSVFVQISDENVHLVRSLLDEVFGSDNFVSLITFSTTTGQTSRFLANPADYLLWYSKDANLVRFKQMYVPKTASSEDGNILYSYVELPTGARRSISSEEKSDFNLLPEGSRIYMLGDLTSQRQNRPSGEGSAMYFPVTFEGKTFYPSGNRGWTTTQVGIQRLVKSGKTQSSTNTLRLIRYFDEFPLTQINSLWTDTSSAALRDKVYVVQTNPKVIERCMLMTTDPGDLVLDPTMGSGTTAYVAEQWGRRWITIDTSRVSLALARTRLMSARFPYYLLADSADGAQKEMEVSGQHQLPRTYRHDVRQGFVYDRVPHITLRDIANNEEIDLIHERWQPYLEERRARLNALMGRSWEEWEIPHPSTFLEVPSVEFVQLMEEYWQGRRDRHAEIDASIAHNSERETLYDKPYTDSRKVRVTGPFTVESLSPHRILDPNSVEIEQPQELANVGSYEQMVIDNLKIAGVQNTRRDERLMFDTLEPYAGVWLHATGTYTDADGEERRVAVSIGSEHGTVTPRQVKSAALEAVKGQGYDVLLICGFAFDAAVSEEAKLWGKMTVQPVRINSDLMMGSVLKKTDRANLFTIFGEPDLRLERQADGRYVVDIQGLDIYDPTTGQIRSNSTDEIACWFIDTDYNQESFFVRHAYFLGKDDAYDNLKRALRAEIDEAAWSALYSTRSLPFDPPENGRIAVKVINHYGDEVLKVYEV